MVANQIHSFQCYYEACAKTFATKFNLRRHVNVSHLSIKAYLCETCGKNFASKQNVKEHRFIHTGEKPFHCGMPGCGRFFRQASQLASHRRTHMRPDRLMSELHSEGGLIALLATSLHDTKALEDMLAERPVAAMRIPQVTQERQGLRSKLPIASALLI